MATATTNVRTSVRGLGEIALRVNNLDAMQKSYEEVIGLPLMTRVPNCAFFKIAEGYRLAHFRVHCGANRRMTLVATQDTQHSPDARRYREQVWMERASDR